ncbi:MAG TPA: DUF1015 domain-containing protein, partial [Agriterribacter sp.]|nr:DUF1015 domain-containing protein [Agriterribacter sp.]
MATIVPFTALRPQAQYAKQVASQPYDVLSSKEAKLEARGNPNSFLHITKAEIDLPEDTGVHDKEVYEKAKDNLDAFIQREVLFRENKPCYYIYRLVMNGRSQTGLVCISSVDDYEDDLIKKHEFTRPEKEQDRLNHIAATGAQTGNVFLAYKNVAEIDTLIEKWQQDKKPVYDFVADDGISHTVWVINDDRTIAAITQIFSEKVDHTYIADGHHRAASAAKVRLTAAGDTAGANYF